MDSLPAKPPSSRGGRDRDRDRTKDRDRSHRRSRHNERDGNRDRDKDRDRNHSRRHHRRRSTSPTQPSSKRPRTSGASHKGTERMRNGDAEPGEIRIKTPEIGDDFIPFGGSDAEVSPQEKPRSERARQKERAAGREWDVGKPPRTGDKEGRGMKRKPDSAFDEEDDRAYRRRQRFEPYVARKAPWVSQVDWDCHNVAEMLHREVEAFVKYMSPTPIEDEIRALVIQLVSNAITSVFPDARISPFGSFETKLYLPNGDIDLVIESNSMARSNKVNVLHALANTLKRAGITSKVTIISKAKVPIVKFVTHFGRLNVDISVNQGNGIKAGKIVTCFLQDMRGCGFALRSLIVIAKAFLNQRGMNEVYTGGLGSYSIVCLAVSFLQMHPKIRRGEIEPEKNLGVLVMEFFELYGCYFNYEEVGISVRNGGSYFSKRQRGWYDPYKGLLLSIEDPTDISNDISKGSYGINKVRQTFAGAFGIMQAATFLRAGILSSRREGHSYRLRMVTNPEEMSILSSILGVTQETINNRRLLQEVYEKRLLHQLLRVPPQASVVTADVPIDQDVKGKPGMEEEWDGDMELESGDEIVEEGNPDESGRYDIQERRLARSGDTNGAGRCDPLTSYYTTDEEDLSEDELEDQAYDIAGSDDDTGKGRMGRRRSYRLSRGIGPHDRDDDDDDEDGGTVFSSSPSLVPVAVLPRGIRTVGIIGPSNHPGWLSFLAGRSVNPSCRISRPATSRGQTPPVNLKERIAALQQRNVSPNTHQSAPRVPSAGTGGLRDKIARFEEKGGVPVPRASFAMGAPQLAENAPPKKRGELYGNRVPGLGRPSGPPVKTDDSESPGPRKRCISADEPVPALPNGLSPRRNSLASGRRVMSKGLEFVDASSADSQPPILELAVDATLLEVDEPQPSSLEALQPLEPPVAEQPSPAEVDPPAEDPTPQNHPSPVVDQSSNDGQSDHESASQPSPSLPEPASSASSPLPIDTPSTAPIPTPVSAETVVTTSPPEEVTEQVAASQGNPIPNPIVSVPPNIPSPNPTTEARSQRKPTFKAVVHRKVAEIPVPPSLDPSTISQGTQQRKSVSGNVVQVPPSPNFGDLAVLLEDAALLELRLTEGDGTALKAKELLAATPTSAFFQPDPRHASASTLTEHAHVPSIDSGSQSMRSVSIPSIREPLADDEIPEGDETDGRSLASTTFSQRSPSHRKYLSNIYRLTSRRSSSYMPGSYPRDSMSMSSEDSSPVTTPSDNGKRKGFGIAWPTTSPKKGGPNMGRSSSFADKIFNRSRTKSNVSTADQASERNSIYESSQPTLSLSFPSELSSEAHPDGEDMGVRPTSWISPVDSNSEFSPASSLLDKDIFDAFPSVPQTLPPGFYLGVENADVGRASTLPVNGRKQVNQRLSMA
ncbi:hypothetical protein J3R82DRAFT_6104 [Butyriboletus roseoflavus]|nr:hypothetical protein J3R82DRAFT_6104 [Butyriboletus roseoflavus]